MESPEETVEKTPEVDLKVLEAIKAKELAEDRFLVIFDTQTFIIDINIDRIFTFTHAAPTCEQIRQEKKSQHAKKGRRVSQGNCPANVY